MSGVRKSQLATFGNRSIRSANVSIAALGLNIVLSAPAAGFVRRVRNLQVLNLDNTTHIVQPQTVGGLPYSKPSAVLAPGATVVFSPILLNAGEDLYVDMDAIQATGQAPLVSLIFEDFAVSSGIGGGILSIAAAASTVLVPAPATGYKRVIGFDIEGSSLDSLFLPRFVERDGTASTIELKVSTQLVGQVDLPSAGEQEADLRLVLNSTQTLATRLITTPPGTPPGTYTLPIATAANPVLPITGSMYWQDVSL
jgi:hypothetical protein